MLPGLSDALEFCQVDGTWLSESGATVEIAAAMPVERGHGGEKARGTARPRLGYVAGELGHARAN
jgi:hypothetical protein